MSETLQKHRYSEGIWWIVYIMVAFPLALMGLISIPYLIKLLMTFEESWRWAREVLLALSLSVYVLTLWYHQFIAMGSGTRSELLPAAIQIAMLGTLSVLFMGSGNASRAFGAISPAMGAFPLIIAALLTWIVLQRFLRDRQEAPGPSS